MRHYGVLNMAIKSIKHKGLEKFYKKGLTSGINSDHAKKIWVLLNGLETAFYLDDLKEPGWGLHALKGDKANQHAVKVNGNWRLTFEFRDGHVFLLNYEDFR